MPEMGCKQFNTYYHPRMPIFITVLYNPRSNDYSYDKCLSDFDTAILRINYFHDWCSIIIYQYDSNIELINTTFRKHILKKVVSGKGIAINNIATPMKSLLLNSDSEYDNVLLFTN